MSDETPPGRWRWLKREAIDLGDVVVQIFAVVIGILLALFINDWVTQRQQQATVDEAIRAIRAELAVNRVDVRNYAARMFDMARHMRDAPANKNQQPRPCYAWDGWDGIGGLTPIDAAYQTSIATQALANMPFDQAQLVAQIYGWQRYTLKGIELDASMLFQKPQPLKFCAGIVEEIGRNAVQLDSLYGKLIGPAAAPLPKLPASSTPPSSH
ncbi:MAG: hypothetical protein KGQ32_04685 [Xanthomonadaceae bacterium]|nr:hypothetical protein [Xanthomonadaceae bacterium]